MTKPRAARDGAGAGRSFALSVLLYSLAAGLRLRERLPYLPASALPVRGDPPVRLLLYQEPEVRRRRYAAPRPVGQ